MTDFYMRDLRNGGELRRTNRKTYRRAARLHDESGQPLRVGTEYRNGVPVKKLTLMSDSTGGET